MLAHVPDTTSLRELYFLSAIAVNGVAMALYATLQSVCMYLLLNLHATCWIETAPHPTDTTASVLAMTSQFITQIVCCRNHRLV